jgi:hypothetical protein
MMIVSFRIDEFLDEILLDYLKQKNIHQKKIKKNDALH